MHSQRVELLTNIQSEERRWVDRSAVTVLFWPDFLRTVYSVSPLAPENYPLRERPLDNASPLMLDYRSVVLLPQYAEGDWLRVMISSDGAPTDQMAWLRWRHEQQLLVQWSYVL